MVTRWFQDGRQVTQFPHLENGTDHSTCLIDQMRQRLKNSYLETRVQMFIIIMPSDATIGDRGKAVVNPRKTGPWKRHCLQQAICKKVCKSPPRCFVRCVIVDSATLIQSSLTGPTATVLATRPKARITKSYHLGCNQPPQLTS